MNKTHDQVLALAGIFQAAYLVTKIAKTGIHPQDSFEASIKSLFSFNPDSTAEIYGSAANLMVGLRICSEIMEKQGALMGANENLDIFRYSLSLLQLERKLARNHAMLDELGLRLTEIDRQTNHFSATHPQILSNIADLYQDTISTFPLRIQVRGEMRFLQNEININKVRALLLAGIRSSLLWYQLGGRRWQLLFSRGRLKQSIRLHMDEIAKLH